MQYMVCVTLDAFAVLADPTRRHILHELGQTERSVGELVAALQVSQPAVSKHLRVLRDSGFVESRTVAQQRMYRVQVEQLQSIDQWLQPFRSLWSSHLDRLERYLDVDEGRKGNGEKD
jgi:DNA-binding transcriptional ArsR family regulator